MAFNILLAGEKVPEPDVVQFPVPAPPVITPDNCKVVFAQIEVSFPANAAGGGVIIIVTVSETALQVPFPVDVIIKSTNPFVISVADGEYVIAKLVVEGEIVPVPIVDQIPVVVAPLITAVKFASGLFEHTFTSAPAETEGPSVIVTTITSVMTEQEFVELKVSVTEPEVVSAALGIYVAFKVLSFGLNIPLPLVLQIPVLEVPFTVPFNKTDALFAQTV